MCHSDNQLLQAQLPGNGPHREDQPGLNSKGLVINEAHRLNRGLALRKHKIPTKEVAEGLAGRALSSQTGRERREPPGSMIALILNPLVSSAAPEVVRLFQAITSHELTPEQRQDAESIISKLGPEGTLTDFVENARLKPGLKQFATALGAFCLPGSGYSELYERDYGAISL